jgi:hypothetical protein
MNTIIESFCTLLESGETPTALKELEAQCGERQVLATALRLLTWLRSPLDRPLELKAGSALSRLILASPDLSLLFEVSDKHVRFRESISQDERQSIKGFVRSKPLGRLMTKV